jgi:hypothetical protein
VNESLEPSIRAAACDLAWRAKFGRVDREDLEAFATDLLVHGVESPSIVELASGSGRIPIEDGVALFQSVLHDLGLPSLSSDEPWWLAPRVAALPEGGIASGGEAFFLRVAIASPAFGVRWDPGESSYYLAARLADFVGDLLDQEATGSEVQAIFDAVEDHLRRDGRDRDLVLVGFLESLSGRYRSAAEAREVERLMGPMTRRLWAKHFEPPRRQH